MFIIQQLNKINRKINYKTFVFYSKSFVDLQETKIEVMKNVNEFIEQMVKVDYLEQFDSFGHYPFQMYVEKKDGQTSINALALGGDVKACHRLFADEMHNSAKTIYMSLDFPKGGDIDNDFVCIFHYDNTTHELKNFAIPYDLEGKVMDRITESDRLSKILTQLQESI